MQKMVVYVRPFNDEPHDHFLAIDICLGKRPKIGDETPKLLKELIQKCWDVIPEIVQLLKKFLWNLQLL
ncbi:hypothetical protein C1645_793276 [Glomus cerebriforme]|uniref:Serine-threonine/tyrosine-protein kinase catalytic domain-containing protein n=1 Tax=Glomus cerebriforme TaxID=658196 RepID=A0A397S5R4_9GLOM|nr:hypothetical protein C1645_793276 [Glomus cerebriforme]